MSTKKILLLIFGGGFFLLLLFCLLLYLTLRTKVDDISDELPYSVFIGEEMILGNDAILVNNYEPFAHEEPLYLDAVGSQLYDGTTIAHYLNKGDVVKIHSAKNFTNGTSGFTNAVIFGTVTTGNPSHTISFEYDWEIQEMEKDAQGVYVFKFELAEWEKER